MGKKACNLRFLKSMKTSCVKRLKHRVLISNKTETAMLRCDGVENFELRWLPEEMNDVV
jgi:hypothetical protein